MSKAYKGYKEAEIKYVVLWNDIVNSLGTLESIARTTIRTGNGSIESNLHAGGIQTAVDFIKHKLEMVD